MSNHFKGVSVYDYGETDYNTPNQVAKIMENPKKYGVYTEAPKVPESAQDLEKRKDVAFITALEKLTEKIEALGAPKKGRK